MLRQTLVGILDEFIEMAEEELLILPIFFCEHTIRNIVIIQPILCAQEQVTTVGSHPCNHVGNLTKLTFNHKLKSKQLKTKFFLF